MFSKKFVQVSKRACLTRVNRLPFTAPVDFRGHYKKPIIVTKIGIDLLRDPVINKGTGFKQAERDQLGLRGLLPPVVKSLEQQMERAKSKIAKAKDNVEKYMLMSSLQDRNETLFYKLLSSDLEAYAPIIYTPTVGVGCLQFGFMYRRPRGLYITSKDKGHILQTLFNWSETDVQVIVVTDGSRVLGLGDLGINGMAISIGKLSLYVAAGGFDPQFTLPIVIDVGTDNAQLRADPNYVGLRQPRVDEQEYYELMDEFIWAVKVRWPNALVQFEDFQNKYAYPLLHKYRFSTRCFNDDIQGTGAVALAGIYCALKQMGRPPTDLKDMRIVCLGAGSAGLGVCNSIFTAMMHEGASPHEAASNFWLVDKDGLLTKNRKELTPAQHNLARSDLEEGLSLLDTVRSAKPTILLGLSGVGNTFTQDIIEEMAKNNERPIIFPLSNPTDNAECSAQQAYEWTDGRAIFSSGSPFAPVEYKGKTLFPSQGNNMFIFPGVGLGAVLCGAERVSVHMFSVAARTLAECVVGDEFKVGKVYPQVNQIRQVSVQIAAAVIRTANETGLATKSKPKAYASIEEWVEAMMWRPDFSPVVRREIDYTTNVAF